MITRKHLLISVVAALGLGATIGSLATRHVVRTDVADKVLWYDRFCRATLSAMREDRRAFESGEEHLQQEARTRFYMRPNLYHNSQNVLMCLGTLPETPVECFNKNDWPCLARFAGELETLLEKASH